MSETIYIVDDDDAVRDSLRALFEAYGFDVRDFASGSDFLEEGGPAATGCVLLDVNLPGIDGFEVLRLLIDSGCRVPVIIMTARTDSRTSENAVKAGAVGFVQKPFGTGDLISLVREALEGSA